jgi:hypothetical protein
MTTDIEIYLNDELIKTYYRGHDDAVVCPRVGEYIVIDSEDMDFEDVDQFEDEFDEAGYMEVQVTKIVHDLEYGYVRIYTKTKRRKI